VTGPARFAVLGSDRGARSGAAAADPANWAEPALPPPREERRPAATARRTGADLALEPDWLEVEPGSAVTATVTVHNLGDEVERFTVEVNGPAGAFATAEPADLRMLPDKKQTAVLRFAPARSPEQAAGPQAFQVVARSTVNPDVMPRASGRVVVGSYTQVDAELTPEVTRGRRPSTHHLGVVNGGNEAAVVAVELHDKDKELTFVPAAFEGRLAPGGRLEHPFTVIGPRPWFGRTQTFPFTAEVRPHGAPQPILLNGTRRQVPRFPWWVPTVALALVGLVIAAVALWPKAKLPNVVGLDEAAASAKIQDAGYVPVVIQQVAEGTDVGRVFKTTPEGGTDAKGQESVSLFVSRDPCDGPCPPLVPDVVRLPLSEATVQLQRAGLTPTEDRQPNADVPVDRVFDTLPKAGQEAPDAMVRVFVSAGPAPTPTSESPATPAGGETTPASTEASPPGGGAGGGGAGGGGAGGGGSVVQMPALAGQVAAAAATALKALPLAVVLETKPTRDNSQPAGTVLSTEPKPGEPLTAGQTVTIFEAAPTNVALDPVTATWTAGTTPLTFPTAPGGAAPIARTERATPGDETSTLLLIIEPVAAGVITGKFGLEEPVIAGDHLRARVMFVDGGVSITVRAGGKALAAPTFGTAQPDGFGDLDVDLTPAVNAKDIEITVTSSGVAGAERVTWSDVRIEGRTK
jgi:beta-lactam-binding protein with PASTA domain